jgi:flagellar assembly factor FliW
MSSLRTRYFGEIAWSADATIRMPLGLPGFEHETAFLLIQLPGQHPLVYLQSMQTPEICFPALPVRVAEPAYELEIGDEDSRVLGVGSRPRIGSEVLCLALLAADEKLGTTANLMAPVVIEIGSRCAVQCVNLARGYLCRHPLGVREVAA